MCQSDHNHVCQFRLYQSIIQASTHNSIHKIILKSQTFHAISQNPLKYEIHVVEVTHGSKSHLASLSLTVSWPTISS